MSKVALQVAEISCYMLRPFMFEHLTGQFVSYDDKNITFINAHSSLVLIQNHLANKREMCVLNIVSESIYPYLIGFD